MPELYRDANTYTRTGEVILQAQAEKDVHADTYGDAYAGAYGDTDAGSYGDANI